ncbi:cbb3-type cytochrome c oxidase N-terminal domain-containing protein [Sunxiuqinia sp. sy24]|uniref:cbb3-type cytochrome c oxidase N-terminal domain-containing protein n=1 Tax=Sunxiuqinia sp. sy24 TaxID=3461495 RepID=UPI0040461E10
MSTIDDKKKDQPKSQHEYDALTNDKLLEGHEFDGIRELDNQLPPWLKYLFYGSIIFAASYLTLVFVFEDESVIQAKEYQNEMAAFMEEEEAAEEDETAVPVIRTEEEIMASGQATFSKICSVCHGKFGEGLVGPNFTDEYWIHGGTRENMHEVITTGVIEKGMISYKNILTENQIQDVITYIRSLESTNPPNQKAPEGEKYVPESEDETAS